MMIHGHRHHHHRIRSAATTASGFPIGLPTNISDYNTESKHVRSSLLPLHNCMDGFQQAVALRKRLRYQHTEIEYLRRQLRAVEEERELLLRQMPTTSAKASGKGEAAAATTPTTTVPASELVKRQQLQIANLRVKMKKMEQQLELQQRMLEQQKDIVEQEDVVTATAEDGATTTVITAVDRQDQKDAQTTATIEEHTTPDTFQQQLDAILRTATSRASTGVELDDKSIAGARHHLITSYRTLYTAHATLRADVAHLDADFFEELEDLKYRHQMALELVEEYERVLSAIDEGR